MAAMKTMLPWTDCKGKVFFYSTTICCVLLLGALYSIPEGSVIPCSGCKLLGPLSLPPSAMHGAKEEQTSRNSSHGSDATFSPASGTRKHDEAVEVLEEWRLPSVADDRPKEQLSGPDTFGEPRRFMPLGSSAFLFVQFGVYRYGPNMFAVVGLGPKSLHDHGNPGFECSWVSNEENSKPVRGWTKISSPDWGLGKQYSCLVVHCTFNSAVGENGSGGKLEFVANHGSSDQTGLPDVKWIALNEEPNKYDALIFGPPFKYDYVYCGSPLFGSLSPQRMREWVAYHVWLFGPRSHFVFYDAGGVHEGVRKVLEPWVELGFVSVLNTRQESRYDDHYYSQFLVNNDCLFKSKTMANWTFFFDVDEYVYVPEEFSFEQVMLDFAKMGRRAQQVHMKQNFMSNNHCRNESLDSEELGRQWALEKLVYRRTQHTKLWGFENRKYAIQARYALSTGVHNSMDTLVPKGQSRQDTVLNEDRKLTYNHYHHTIDNHGEICEKFVDPSLNLTKLETRGEWGWHVLDFGMSIFADAVREFENRTVGQLPFVL